jgi:hypothetical protein
MLIPIISFIVIPLVVWIVLHNVSKRRETQDPTLQIAMEECALCHEEFPVDELMEKEVGGYSRVYCFCGGCIESLYREYQAKREAAIGESGN